MNTALAPNIIELHTPAVRTGKSKTFTWRRAQYRVFTRTADADASWYFQIIVSGQRLKQSLKTTVEAVAIERAKLLLEAQENGLTQKMRALLNGGSSAGRPAFTPLSEIYTFLEHQPSCPHASIKCLKLVLRTLFATPEALSAECLAPDLARRWKKHTETKAAGKSQVEANRIMRSANSIMHQAVNVFSRERLADLRLAGFTLPDMSLFKDEIKARKFKRLPKKQYFPLARSLVATALVQWRALPRNEFLAVGLMLSCGLRKSAAAQVRWSWMTTEEGRPVLTGEADVKNHSARIHVFPIDPFWRLMQRRIAAEQWTACDQDYVLAGSPTERCEKVFRRISAWLRKLGWPMQKTNHAFRDYAGSLVAMRYGLDGAREFLDHASVTTTETYYASFIKSHATRGRAFIKWAA